MERLVKRTSCPSSAVFTLATRRATGVTTRSSTTTVAVASLSPAEFDTCRRTVYEPGWVHACETVSPLALVPSPKSQLRSVGLPVDRLVNVTVWLTLAAVAPAEITAVGWSTRS